MTLLLSTKIFLLIFNEKFISGSIRFDIILNLNFLFNLCLKKLVSLQLTPLPSNPLFSTKVSDG